MLNPVLDADMAGALIAPDAGQQRAHGGPRVLVLCQYARGTSPGQRFRYEQYLEFLASQGVCVDDVPFFDLAPSALHRQGEVFRKCAMVLSAFSARVKLARRFKQYDRIFIFREAAPLGPPLIEWLAIRSGVPVVYDLDDAVFIAQTAASNRFVKWLKFPGRASYVARYAERVCVCNRFLENWALEHNPNVLILPTSIDLEYHRGTRDRSAHSGVPVVGWTGSQTTAVYLDLVRPALKLLQDDFDFEFRVICDVDPGFPELRNYRFVKWRRETEIADLDQLDIGIMPVPEGTWEMGKVGFKAIQYGAMEIPPVVSVTGSGPEVVDDGVTGLVVANTTEAWALALRRLLSSPDQAAAMGRAARIRVAASYSTAAQRHNYMRVFKGLN